MEKKTKLTISGTAKKSFKNIEIAKTQGKNSVVIEKQTSKFPSRGGLSKPGGFKPKTTSTFNRSTSVKPSFTTKSPPITNDFERRKLAEQRATKRLKGERVKIQGYLEDFALSKEEADELIMSARNIVYKD